VEIKFDAILTSILLPETSYDQSHKHTYRERIKYNTDIEINNRLRWLNEWWQVAEGTEKNKWKYTYFRLIPHGLHRKRLWQFFVPAGTFLPSCYLATIGGTQTNPQTHASNNSSIVACIRFGGNMFTEPLPSNEKKGIHMKTHKMMEGIYKGYRWDGLRRRDIHTTCRKDWVRRSKVGGGRIHRHTDSMDIA
jgi:hypothetical protein